jgi:hypothetical protein
MCKNKAIFAERIPSLGPYLIGSALSAVWISLGSLHRDQHSDSIVNILMSLQRWTPFYWEQDRFGTLVPLLALPIRHPLANLIVQAILSSFAGLATVFLLARLAFRDANYPLVGLVGTVSLLTLTPSYFRFEYLVDTSYGISLALALWGLILIEPKVRKRPWISLIGATMLMGLAHWVNSVTAFFLGPVVLIQGLKDRIFLFQWTEPVIGPSAGSVPNRIQICAREFWYFEPFRSLALLGIGHAIGQSLIALCPEQSTDYSALSWREWPDGWRHLIGNTREALGSTGYLLALAIEAAIGLVGLARSGGKWSRNVVWLAAGLVLSAVVLWLLMGTRTWVKINGFSFRYLFPTILLLQTAAAGLAIGSFRITVPASRWPRLVISGLATVLLLGASAWSYGQPSISGVRRDVDRKFGALTEDLLASHCLFVAGDYWKIWGAVFHVKLVLYETRDPRPFWGLTYRCLPTLVLWMYEPPDQFIAGVPHGDDLGEAWLRSLPARKFELVEIRQTIRVFRPTDAPRKVP